MQDDIDVVGTLVSVEPWRQQRSRAIIIIET